MLGIQHARISLARRRIDQRRAGDYHVFELNTIYLLLELKIVYMRTKLSERTNDLTYFGEHKYQNRKVIIVSLVPSDSAELTYGQCAATNNMYSRAPTLEYLSIKWVLSYP